MFYNVVNEVNGVIEPFMDVGTWTDLFSNAIGVLIKISRIMFMEHNFELRIYYPTLELSPFRLTIDWVDWTPGITMPPLIEVFLASCVAGIALRCMFAVIKWIKG